MAAADRRREREARRRQRELEKQQAQLEKMQERERAAYEAQVYENRIDLLLSVHKQCSVPLDWCMIQASEPPTKPTKSDMREQETLEKLDSYEPRLFDKLLKRTESTRAALVQNIERAKSEDEEEYQKALQAYEQEYSDWEAMRELANRVLGGSTKAYIDVIGQINSFSDISELGSSVKFHIESEENPIIEAVVCVNSEQVIPSNDKRVLKSGKLSVKPMPKTRFYELYQDYICGCVLRIARELFALLPVEMVIVTAVGNLLNTETGYMEEQAILSAAIPRKTLVGLNFEALDPSDSLNNFVHRMNFRQRSGFRSIEAIIDLRKVKGTSIAPAWRVGRMNGSDESWYA